MVSKYEKTQGTTVSITDGPSTTPNPVGGTWIDAQCATKEISYTGGQKSDIDVTTLCSTEQEQTNGLAAPAEMTLSRNWAGSEAAQEALQTAYDNDEIRAIKVVFPSGNGFSYLCEVRQNSWSASTSGVVTASYTLRIKGKPERIRPATT